MENFNDYIKRTNEATIRNNSEEASYENFWKKYKNDVKKTVTTITKDINNPDDYNENFVISMIVYNLIKDYNLSKDIHYKN